MRQAAMIKFGMPLAISKTRTPSKLRCTLADKSRIVNPGFDLLLDNCLNQRLTDGALQQCTGPAQRAQYLFSQSAP